MRSVLARAGAALLVALTACATPPPQQPSAAVATDSDLPRCGKPPSPAPYPAPPGALIPPDTVLTAVREEGSLTQLNAYAMQTPAEVRAWIESDPDLEVIAAEGDDALVELLVTDGEFDTFVSARAVCATASAVSQVVAPAAGDHVLPTPDGSNE